MSRDYLVSVAFSLVCIYGQAAELPSFFVERWTSEEAQQAIAANARAGVNMLIPNGFSGGMPRFVALRKCAPGDSDGVGPLAGRGVDSLFVQVVDEPPPFVGKRLTPEEREIANLKVRAEDLENECEGLAEEIATLQEENKSLKEKLAEAERLLERCRPRQVPAAQPAVPKPGDKPLARPQGPWRIGANGERFAEDFPPGTVVEKDADGVWRRAANQPAPQPRSIPPSVPAYDSPTIPFPMNNCPNGRCRLGR